MRPTLLIPVLALTACATGETHSRTAWATFEGIDRIELDYDAGDVTVIGADVEVVSGERTLTWSGEEPFTDTVVDGNVLTLLATCPKLSVCSVDLVLEVPRWVSVEAKLGSGNGSFTGFQGELLADVGSGDLDFAELSGPVTATTGSGDLRLRDLAGSLELETGSGDVTGSGLSGSDLVFALGSGDVAVEAAAPTVSHVTVETGSGDIALEVAAGDWQLSLDTGSGDVSQQGVSNDKSSDRSLDLSTGSGDVSIQGV